MAHFPPGCKGWRLGQLESRSPECSPNLPRRWQQPKQSSCFCCFLGHFRRQLDNKWRRRDLMQDSEAVCPSLQQWPACSTIILAHLLARISCRALSILLLNSHVLFFLLSDISLMQTPLIAHYMSIFSLHTQGKLCKTPSRFLNLQMLFYL